MSDDRVRSTPDVQSPDAPPLDDGPAGEAERARRRAAQRARIASIFGENLPDAGGDEIARNSARERGRGGGDEWLRSNVPPHHG